MHAKPQKACLLVPGTFSCANEARAGQPTYLLNTLAVLTIDIKASLMLGLLKQVVVILGTGAFACEAMEASLRNGAKHVYMLSRERIR